MEIPIELVEEIGRGNAVLFLGWEDSSITGVLNEAVLAQHLADRANYHDYGKLYEVAEYFQVQSGKLALVQYVCDVIEKYRNRTPDYYRSIARLPFTAIVTTSLDNSLEEVLQSQKRKPQKIIRDEEVPFDVSDRLPIVKLYGDESDKTKMLITREDRMHFFDGHPIVFALLKYYFNVKTLLFIGYDLDDPLFLQFYLYANQPTRSIQRRAYAVKSNPSEYEKRLWETRNLLLIDASPKEFLEKLARQVSSLQLPLMRDPITLATDDLAFTGEPHKSPYKFLSSYEEQDADIFFGRDLDTFHATRTVLSSKLTVLYGKSGYGKTSLLRAGIIPRLIRSGYLPLYARCTADPLVSIKTRAIEHLVSSKKVQKEKITRLQSLTDKSLADFILEFKEMEDRPLVIFLDQFEEFFISLGDATRKQFQHEVAECIDSPYVSSSFVLSLREDFLAELHELRELYHVYRNLYRLRALNNEQATEAITKPAHKFNMTYEDGLVRIILQQLSDKGEVDPAQLQIVCDRLYNSLPEGASQITHALFTEMGGVRQILADYVDSILDNLGPKRRPVAQTLLRSMVTSLFTRAVLTLDDATLETSNLPGWSEADTKHLLTELVQARLIRRVAEVDDESYELTHEYLINKIRGWIDLETLKVKEAQDLLRQEYNNWQRHKIPMSRSAMEIVNAQREKLPLDRKLSAFILAAAIAYDLELSYWTTRNMGKDPTDLILPLLREGQPRTKILAGIVLAIFSREDTVIKEIYQAYESIANPNTVKRIMELQAEGLPFVQGFLEQVKSIVEHRFTRDMVLVARGDFLIGASKEEIDLIREANQLPTGFFEGQYPQRKIYLDDFYVDKYLVTNAEFQEFKPTHTFPLGHEQHPATNVTWHEARAYARWLGKDLPTEEEWEKAARGTDGRKFPWGDEWDPARCNTRLSGIGGTTPVGQFATGISPYGCYDMAGNVWKWTSTRINEGGEIVLKGGSWSKYGVLPWCFYRFSYEPDSEYSNVGFMCVRRTKNQSEEWHPSGQLSAVR